MLFALLRHLRDVLHVAARANEDDLGEPQNLATGLHGARAADLGKTGEYQYRDLPMDFADAALVRVAGREEIRTVSTLDRGDFEFYRPARIGRFSIVP